MPFSFLLLCFVAFLPFSFPITVVLNPWEKKNYMSFKLLILTNSGSLDGLRYRSISLEKGRVLFALFASLVPKT